MVFRPTTIESKSFADELALPEALADLVDVIRDQARGAGVVSSSLRVSLRLP